MTTLECLQINIRDADRSDIPALLPMIRALAQYHGDDAAVSTQSLARDAFEDPPWIYIVVAELEERIIGYAALCPLMQLQTSTRGIDMHHLFIEEEHRGRGVGKQLIDGAISKARDLNCSYMMVGASQRNTAAQAVYLSYGFKKRPQSGAKFRFHI
ncbi:GNAT family N-acetyltransferase [Pseudovibrio sp. Ad26]|uniref:GNAT family N-acetyltransferase n=1 Tax=Pseudovibrio sp. Ad26 TaxID=989410 RepID=UPI0007AE574B|nr:GNAT family N-acetyltransferase [Pseudovibrio sp. Ad26]KZL16492.1 N-acyltransferase YncA [Pseudovibrio sp. Ad26]